MQQCDININQQFVPTKYQVNEHLLLYWFLYINERLSQQGRSTPFYNAEMQVLYNETWAPNNFPIAEITQRKLQSACPCAPSVRYLLPAHCLRTALQYRKRSLPCDIVDSHFLPYVNALRSTLAPRLYFYLYVSHSKDQGVLAMGRHSPNIWANMTWLVVCPLTCRAHQSVALVVAPDYPTLVQASPTTMLCAHPSPT